MNTLKQLPDLYEYIREYLSSLKQIKSLVSILYMKASQITNLSNLALHEISDISENGIISEINERKKTFFI